MKINNCSRKERVLKVVYSQVAQIAIAETYLGGIRIEVLSTNPLYVIYNI